MAKEATKKVVEEFAFDPSEVKLEWIPVKYLIIRWPGAQRVLKDTHAKTIAANFDPDKFGLIEVSAPDERGYYHVIDGFNRVQAITMMWGPEEQVLCRILVNVKDPKRAAQIFLGLNKGRKPVTPINTFRVGVTAGDPDKVEINKIVRSLGYRIDTRGAEGSIGAVAALASIYNRYGGDILKSTLELVQATWGMDGNAPIGPILNGYATFLAAYGNKANWGRLKSTVAKRFTPGKLLGHARTLRETERNGLNDAMVRLLVNTYNRGLKIGALGEYKE